MKVNEIWKIRHSRKGTFVVKVLSIGEEWTDVELINGQVNFLSDYNSCEVGESMTIRNSFITPLEQIV
jgi:hypothetical protein